jgi:hypothetical protein
MECSREGKDFEQMLESWRKKISGEDYEYKGELKMMPTVETISWLKEHNIEYKEITVKEAFEAGAENGFDLLRGEWFSYEGKTYPVGGCFLGQAAINKGVVAESFALKVETGYSSMAEGLNLHDQLNRFLIPVDSKWVIPSPFNSLTIRELGRVITHWNDAVEGQVYVLRTYKEIVNMAREVMTPFFDEKILVISHDYRIKDLAEQFAVVPF